MLRHDEAGRDTLVTAELSAATERVRVVPVTVVAEPAAPLCSCSCPRISWGDVHGRDPRYVVWFCASCLSGGFVAFPGADDWAGRCMPRDLSTRQVEAPLIELADALGETVDALALFVRHADDLVSRRSRHRSVEAIAADLKDGIAQTCAEIRERYERAERDRAVAEARRQDEHDTLVRRLRHQVRSRRDSADRSLSRRKAPAESSTYAIVVRGADAVKPLVYGLVDPAEPNRVRYVGKTTQGAHTRFLGHVKDARRGTKKRADWVAELLELGRPPNMVVLETVPVGADLDARERWWITAMRARGEADLNTAVPQAGSAGAGGVA